jgi:hypothetical protein
MKLTRPANKDFSNPFAPGPNPVRHSGLDFGHGAGTEVRAAAPGRVVSVYGGGGTNGGWGNRIIIEHAPGVFTAYAHLRTGSIGVKVNDTVSAGQLITQMGNTGTKDVHLHFELMIGGSAPENRVDPAPYFSRDLPGTGGIAPSGGVRVSRTVKQGLPSGFLNGRLKAQVDDNPIPQKLPCGAVGEFDGYVIGQTVTVGGTTSNIWLRGAYRGNYFAAAGFTSQDVSGLPNLGGTVAAPVATSEWFDVPADGQYFYRSLDNAVNGRVEAGNVFPGRVMQNGQSVPLALRVTGRDPRGPVQVLHTNLREHVWVGTRRNPAKTAWR